MDSLATLVFGLGGFILTFVALIVTWRFTLGAAEVRAREANSLLVRVVLRRMVLEEYQPVYDDLTDLIDGTARRFNVRTHHLMREEEIIPSLLVEVMENDLITPVQRQRLIEHLRAVPIALHEQRDPRRHSEWIAVVILLFPMLAVSVIGMGFGVGYLSYSINELFGSQLQDSTVRDLTLTLP